MFFKYIILSFVFSIHSFSHPLAESCNYSPESTSHLSVHSNNKISSSNQYTSVSQHTSITKVYNKNNTFKYVTYGAIFSGILYLFYKIWKAHHNG